MAIKRYQTVVIALPVILIAGFAAWISFFALAKSGAETSVQPTSAQTMIAVTPDEPQAQPDAAPAAQQPGAIFPEPAQTDHLRISRQSFRRGGLGSKALVTFTLRNDNDYAVKDLEILCSFRSRDGRYSTERRRTLSDTVDTRSRKTFSGTLVGFVNIRASRAKCSLLTASRA